MADQPSPDRGTRHSAVYSYLRPILIGRRVLEIGCGLGEGTAHLVRLGVRSVVGADDPAVVAEARSRNRTGAVGFVALTPTSLEQTAPFDVVLLPEAADILLDKGPLPLALVLKLVAPGGRLVCVAPNGDRPDEGGLSYYDLLDRLTPHFPKVRMFGQTPFAAYGIAEFDETPSELHVDPELGATENEQPTHYVALAGQDEALSLGYALVQIPCAAAQVAAVETAPSTLGLSPGAKAPDSAIAELRQKLAESQGQIEGLIRVSRAQTDEIEELRNRVRRTSEARSEADDEVRRLRAALLEADESVVNLTRKTTEEMTALAQRLTSGLRAGEPEAAVAEDLKRHEAALAERESALAERDDRIAALEASRQEAAWRADAAEDELGRVRAEMVALRQAPPPPVERPSRTELLQARAELLETVKTKDQALAEFQRASAAHLDEAGRLRDAINEQSSLVAELEEDLAGAEKRLSEALHEADGLRKSLAEVEEADRQRRSRLAELEGLMLRAQRTQSEAHVRDEGAVADLRTQLASCQAEATALRTQLATAQTEVTDLRGQLAEAERRLADSLHLRDDTERARKQLEVRVSEMEAMLPAARAALARIPELEAKLAEASADAARIADLETQLVTAREDAACVPDLENQLAAARADSSRIPELEKRLRAAESATAHVVELETRLQTAQTAASRMAELEQRLQAAGAGAARLAELEAQAKRAEETAARLAELRAETPDPGEVYERLALLEMQHDAAMLSAARVPTLEAQLASAMAKIADLTSRLAATQK